MTDGDPRETDRERPPGEAARPRRDGEPERDFGDSAGYGTGGSALDYHEVGDENASPIKGKRNPLDDVMKPEPPDTDER